MSLSPASSAYRGMPLRGWGRRTLSCVPCFPSVHEAPVADVNHCPLNTVPSRHDRMQRTFSDVASQWENSSSARVLLRRIAVPPEASRTTNSLARKRVRPLSVKMERGYMFIRQARSLLLTRVRRDSGRSCTPRTRKASGGRRAMQSSSALAGKPSRGAATTVSRNTQPRGGSFRFIAPLRHRRDDLGLVRVQPK